MHGCQVADELMRHSSLRNWIFCILVRNDTGNILFKLPFAAANQNLALWMPEAKALVERCCEKRRDLAEVLHAVRKTVLQTRALVARSRGKPFLCVENGDRIA
jgi:hypothetical protein